MEQEEKDKLQKLSKTDLIEAIEQLKSRAEADKTANEEERKKIFNEFFGKKEETPEEDEEEAADGIALDKNESFKKLKKRVITW